MDILPLGQIGRDYKATAGVDIVTRGLVKNRYVLLIYIYIFILIDMELYQVIVINLCNVSRWCMNSCEEGMFLFWHGNVNNSLVQLIETD